MYMNLNSPSKGGKYMNHVHKLELLILDVVKSWKYLSDFFEEVIKGIYEFYHYSPKRRRELKAISDILDNDLVHFSSIKQVRWLASKSRALDAVKNVWNRLLPI